MFARDGSYFRIPPYLQIPAIKVGQGKTLRSAAVNHVASPRRTPSFPDIVTRVSTDEFRKPMPSVSECRRVRLTLKGLLGTFTPLQAMMMVCLMGLVGVYVHRYVPSPLSVILMLMAQPSAS